jgi:hypothetical protein
VGNKFVGNTFTQVHMRALSAELHVEMMCFLPLDIRMMRVELMGTLHEAARSKDVALVHQKQP